MTIQKVFDEYKFDNKIIRIGVKGDSVSYEFYELPESLDKLIEFERFMKNKHGDLMFMFVVCARKPSISLFNNIRDIDEVMK